jgi:hypothetical protein
MTIEELKGSDKEMLTVNDISSILGCDPYNIAIQAKEDARNLTRCLGFPVIIMGSRVRIPRRAFLKFLGVD